MLEVWTQTLTHEEMRDIVRSLRKCAVFRAAKRSVSQLTLCQPQLPDLSGYDFFRDGNIRMRSDKELSCDSARDALFSLVNSLGEALWTWSAFLHIAESGQNVKSTEEYDLWLMYGRSHLAPFVWVEIGPASLGTNDISYRKRLLDGFLSAIHLDEDVQTSLEQGVLVVQPVSPGIILPSPSASDEAMRNTCSSGTKLLVLRSRSNDGRNPLGVDVYGFSVEELRQKVTSLLTHWGRDKVISSDISLTCYSARYSEVKGILDRCSDFGPWRVGVSVIAKYTIDTLEQATSENQSLMMRLGTLKPKGVGAVDLDLHYNKGEFMLCFYTEYKSNKQERLLHELITELAGGNDIIDHTPL